MNPKISHSEVRRKFNYNPDTGVFTRLTRGYGTRVGYPVGYVGAGGYRLIRVGNREQVKAHRLAWFYVTGKWPEDQIDHVNRDRQDNRFANLREASNAQNRANTVASSNTGIKGVYFRPETGKFVAKMTFQRKHRHLGAFDTAEEASAVYRRAAAAAHGEFARFE